MKKASNMSKKLIAILLSAAMTFTPMMQSMPVYAAETQNETEDVGTMPQADELDDAVSDNDSDAGDAEEAPGEEQNPAAAATGDDAKDDVSDDHSKDDASDDGKDTDTGKVEENTEEKTEAKEDTKPSETLLDPVYEEVLEEESESASGSEEESETESEEMSLEEVRATATVTGVTDADIKVGGWNESIYAEISKVKGKENMSAITEVSWTGAATGALTDEDLEYLVRPGEGEGARIDIPGLKEGTYNLTIKVNGSGEFTKTGIKVQAYDRSGFAHFNYTRGVGAYNNDGTLKNNAEVLYVTDENKNDVQVTAGGVTVKGIGNILNSVGKNTGGETTSNGGAPNTNQGVIQKLASEGRPLVVRFIGTVSDGKLNDKGQFPAAQDSLITGLTKYDSVDYGGTVGDNGHMARIQSGKDITLEGIGYDATIDGWGFHFISEGANPQLGESFEVRNLKFINTPEDAVGMEGQQSGKNVKAEISSSVERCWIHHNEFYGPEIANPAESDKSEGDGSVDFKRGQYFTCSYNYFEGCHKTNLVGSADYSLQYNLTYHHNYWKLCKARGPLTRNANVHMYNNIWEMQTDYAQNTRANAYIFSEYNMFYACKSPQAVEDGAIKSYHDTISSILQNKGSKGTVVTDKSTYVPNACQYQFGKINYDKFDTNPNQSYIPRNNYELEEDFTQLRKIITAQTGVMEKTPRNPDDVDESEYSVISRLGDPVVPVQVPADGSTTTLHPGDKNGKINKTGYAFSVNQPINIKITYSSTSKLPGVLVNAAGENLLTGSGEVMRLPAGTYMIQSEGFQPGDPIKLTNATFKEATIESVEITAFDTSKHYHTLVKDTAKCVAPTCTEDGKDVYKCSDSSCDTPNYTEEKTIKALGHDWRVIETTATCTQAGVIKSQCLRCNEQKEENGAKLSHEYEWVIDVQATTEAAGSKHEECKVCGDKTSLNTEIPKLTGSSSGGGLTAAGKYVLTFENGQANDENDFFTVNGGAYIKLTSHIPTVNGEQYADSFRLTGTSTAITFTCNEGATLYIVCATDNKNKKIKIDGVSKPTDNNNATLTVANLSAGEHKITKDGEPYICYLSVDNKESDTAYCTLTLDYNYDDAPEDMEVPVVLGKKYATMEDLIPLASFIRRGYTLAGLYADAECTKPIAFPYMVPGNVKMYADWVENAEVSHSLIFNSMGGTDFASVRVLASQVYGIEQIPTNDGYIFAGWYDAATGGNLVSSVDGSKMTGNMTVYARWVAGQVTSKEFVLDCNTDLGSTDSDITEKTTIHGFTLHVLPEGGGANKDAPKYYMSTTKKGADTTKRKLGTNGARITDKTIAGNEDGLLKSIEFTAESKGTLVVEVELSSKDENNGNYYIVLAEKTSDNPLTITEVGREKITKVTTVGVETFKFPFDEAGTYYVYPEGAKGVRYTSLKVQEQEDAYTIIYQAGTGTAPAGLTSVVKAAGDPVEIPGACTPAPGYEFKGWTIDGTNLLTGTTYTVKDEDASDGVIVMKALYNAKTYTIKYNAGDGKLPAGLEQNATVSAGQTVTLKDCTPPTKYEFKGWKVGSTEKMVKASYTVNGADADESSVITLTAVYEKEGTGDNEDPSDKKTGMEIVGVADSYEFTGAKIIPDIEVWDYDNNGGKLLAPDVDYKVTYKNNVKISTNETDPKKQPQVIVTGKGNYAGKGVTKSFEIKEAVKVTEGLINLKGAKIDKIPDEEYALELVNGNSKGKPHYPDFKLTVKKGDNKTTITETYEYDSAEGVYKVKEAEDTSRIGKPIAANVAVSNNVNKGTATILITGGKNKETDRNATSVKKTFKITAVDLSKADVEVGPIAPVEYAVNGAVPTGVNVTIESDGKDFTLKPGKDYTVKYGNNKKVTTGQEKKATVTITGKGNFAKKYKETVQYEITPLDMSKLKVNAVTACEGMKPGKVKATVVDKNGAALKASQYVVKVYAAETGDALCEDTLAAKATIYVAVEAKDVKNLTGATKREPFKVGKDFSKAKIVLKKGEDGKVITKAYTGSAINLTAGEITVSYRGEPENLTPGEDYEIAECINNVNKGTATAIVKGIGEYSGTKTVKFKIVGKDMTIDRWTPWEDFKSFLNGLTKQTK